MLYFLLGNNEELKKKYLAESRQKHYAEVNFRQVDSLDFKSVEFEQDFSGEALFGQADGYVLYDMCGNQENRDFFVRLLGHGTKRPVYFLESKIPDDSFLESFQEKEVHFFKKEADRPDFTLFAAVYARDKKATWLTYLKKLEQEPVDLIYSGILAQFKNMYKVTGVHKKLAYKELGFTTEGSRTSAIRGARNYTDLEIKQAYYELTLLPSQARSEHAAGLEAALEQFILERI